MNEIAPKLAVEGTVSTFATQPQATTVAEPGSLPARRASDRAELGSEQLQNLDRMTNAALGKLTMGDIAVSLRLRRVRLGRRPCRVARRTIPARPEAAGQRPGVEHYAVSALDARLIARHPAGAGRPSLRAPRVGELPLQPDLAGLPVTADWWREATTVSAACRAHNVALCPVARQLLTRQRRRTYRCSIPR